VTHPESKPGTPRSPLVALAYALVLLMTLYSLAINNITFATNDYRSIVIQAVAVAAGALLATILIWRRVPAAGRVMLALCCLANFWTLVDAGGRRLPAVMGW
jgi:uncharacterized YccA/Bax inhibitor family protein